MDATGQRGRDARGQRPDAKRSASAGAPTERDALTARALRPNTRADGSFGRDAADDRDIRPGTVIGSYLVEERIGSGGMGLVYRARHVHLRRKVAIKVLRADRTQDAIQVRRFLEEARAVADLGHPNIVQVFDFAEHLEQDPPRAYIVMELLVGEDVAARLDHTGPLEPRLVVTIGRQVTAALDAVHAAKVLHRDLKPDNIFVVNGPDGAPHVKLLDFGIAKSFGEGQRLDLTGDGAVGTPEYMAPEQILRERLDERTDVYALGLTLYEMLSGRKPFEAPSYGKLLMEQLKSRPGPLMGVDNALGPIPRDLEQVVMRCLEKDPDRRYSSMAELGLALDACEVLAPVAGEVIAPSRGRVPLVDTGAIVAADAESPRPRPEPLISPTVRIDALRMRPGAVGGVPHAKSLIVGAAIVAIAMAGLAWWTTSSSERARGELAATPRDAEQTSAASAPPAARAPQRHATPQRQATPEAEPAAAVVQPAERRVVAGAPQEPPAAEITKRTRAANVAKATRRQTPSRPTKAKRRRRRRGTSANHAFESTLDPYGD